ncbi:uncharacterized protein ARMOST_07670 [Armillaria ostoyae]|uniref:Uncharacterized protein n=1 Tax=Armillaria ostoyae TaxID=47428 RepID=A0A284R6G2_ARMOS|nr:uncharacterized protein ARMOST_07670 [Armillaria ostoyae]
MKASECRVLQLLLSIDRFLRSVDTAQLYLVNVSDSKKSTQRIATADTCMNFEGQPFKPLFRLTLPATISLAASSVCLSWHKTLTLGRTLWSNLDGFLSLEFEGVLEEFAIGSASRPMDISRCYEDKDCRSDARPMSSGSRCRIGFGVPHLRVRWSSSRMSMASALHRNSATLLFIVILSILPGDGFLHDLW